MLLGLNQGSQRQQVISGKTKQARAALEELEMNPQGDYVSPFYRAMLDAGLEECQNALAQLEKAYDDHDEWISCLSPHASRDFRRRSLRFLDRSPSIRYL